MFEASSMFQVPCCGRGLLMMQPGVVYKFAVDEKCSFGGKRQGMSF